MTNTTFAPNPEHAEIFEQSFHSMEPDLFPPGWSHNYIRAIWHEIPQTGFGKLQDIDADDLAPVFDEIEMRALELVKMTVEVHAHRMAAGALL